MVSRELAKAEPAGALAGTFAQAPISGRRAGRLSLAGIHFVYDWPDSQSDPASFPLRSRHPHSHRRAPGNEDGAAKLLEPRSAAGEANNGTAIPEQPALTPRLIDMFSRVNWYCERAAEARRRAAETRDPSIKSAYETMAREWATLAEQVEWIENQRRSPPSKKTELPT